MQKTNYKKRITGIVGLLISVILIIYFSDLIFFLIDFGEKYLSSDNHIVPDSVLKIKSIIIYFILLTIALSVLFILNLTRKIHLFLNTFFQTNKAIKFFLTDDICSKKRLSLYILVIGTMFAFFLFLYLLIFGQPSKEGPMEKYSSLLFLFSAIILIISITRINRMLYSSVTQKKTILSLLAISGILLLIFGEEINWGQRVFSWDSFGVFNEYNYQYETNVHNFFNPLFNFIYPTVGISSFLVLFFIWFFPKKRKTYLFNLFSPHPSLFFLAFIMACSSISRGSEIFEELLAIFGLLYSFRIFMCLSSPKIDLYSQEKYVL